LELVLRFVSAVASGADGLFNPFTGVLAAFGYALTGIFPAFAGTLASRLPAFANTLAGVLATFANPLAGIFAAFADTFTGILPAFGSALAGILPAFANTLAGVLATFADRFADVLSRIAYVLNDLRGSARHQAERHHPCYQDGECDPTPRPSFAWIHMFLQLFPLPFSCQRLPSAGVLKPPSLYPGGNGFSAP
jgi:hypothetical protein